MVLEVSGLVLGNHPIDVSICFESVFSDLLLKLSVRYGAISVLPDESFDFLGLLPGWPFLGSWLPGSSREFD